MSQITGALIGISLVLTAVFIPMAFFSGSVGTIYRQFFPVLVSSMLFSVFLAMSLTPRSLCHALEADSQRAQAREARIFLAGSIVPLQNHDALSIIRRANPET